jgi:hypothetical protein
MDQVIYTILFSVLFLTVGTIGGWFAAERYIAFMTHVEHDFEELFQENPHPELFDKNGKLNRGDYLTLNFEPGYDPENFDPEDIIFPDDEMDN